MFLKLQARGRYWVPDRRIHNRDCTPGRQYHSSP